MNNDARRYVIIVFFLLVGAIYTVRLFYMQVIDESWTLRAQQIAEKRKQITPPRGVFLIVQVEKSLLIKRTLT